MRVVSLRCSFVPLLVDYLLEQEQNPLRFNAKLISRQPCKSVVENEFAAQRLWLL